MTLFFKQLSFSNNRRGGSKGGLMADLVVSGDINGDGVLEIFSARKIQKGTDSGKTELTLEALIPPNQFESLHLRTVVQGDGVFLSFADVDGDRKADLIFGYIQGKNATRRWTYIPHDDLTWQLGFIMPKPNTLRITSGNFDIVYKALQDFNKKTPIEQIPKDEKAYGVRIGSNTYVFSRETLQSMWTHMDYQKKWSPELRYEFDYIDRIVGP